MNSHPGKPHPSGPETLVRDILHGLSEGRFAPGQRLAEPDLMARYGVGRSTVREALGRLAAGGVVTLAPHRGAHIRLLTRRETADVLRVSEYLLGLAARQAAEAVLAGGDPSRLVAAADAYTHADAATESRARARYYRALIELGGNSELERLLPALQVHLIRAQLRSSRHASAENERAALVAAIRAGQPGTAERTARIPIATLIARLDDLPDSAFAAEGG
ncbi:MAG: transcriptional regulator [Rhodobacteraceae bacterium HLUCCA12]|nr:MAG: transcriptional regulator [Rhodobacteraceae bacterium HLUCCA12]